MGKIHHRSAFTLLVMFPTRESEMDKFRKGTKGKTNKENLVEIEGVIKQK